MESAAERERFDDLLDAIESGAVRAVRRQLAQPGSDESLRARDRFGHDALTRALQGARPRAGEPKLARRPRVEIVTFLLDAGAPGGVRGDSQPTGAPAFPLGGRIDEYLVVP